MQVCHLLGGVGLLCVCVECMLWVGRSVCGCVEVCVCVCNVYELCVCEYMMCVCVGFVCVFA